MFEGIKKNVFFLGLVSLLNDTSSEIIMPLLPIFLTTVLGADASVVGLIEGVAQATASISKAISGWFSDRIHKRKKFLVVGYSLSALSKTFYGLSVVWPHVLLLRFLDRVGKGVRGAPRDAMISDSTAFRYRGKAYGFHRAMDTLGAVLGPILAILLLPILGMRMLFIFAAIPAFIGVIIVTLFVKEKISTRLRKKIKRITLTNSLKRFFMVLVVFALGNFSFAFLILRAKDVGIATEHVIGIYLLFNIVYALVSMPAGKLSDRIGRKKTLVLGYFTFFFVCIGFALASSWLYILLFFALYGIFKAINEPVYRAFVVDLSKRGTEATSLGVAQMLIGIMAFPSSVIAGLLWTHFGPKTTFLFGAVTAAFAIVLLMMFHRQLE
ncbi:MAG: MFS transporter [Candidatus Diapherotrites archaeon]|nr:MFS transporter [Candidatus Diapherotrites archaeon]